MNNVRISSVTVENCGHYRVHDWTNSAATHSSAPVNFQTPFFLNVYFFFKNIVWKLIEIYIKIELSIQFRFLQKRCEKRPS